MNKYNLIPLKSHKAGVEHTCYSCNEKIKAGEEVFYQSDKFIKILSKKKFCKKCFNKHGQKLIKIKKIKIDKNQQTLL